MSLKFISVTLAAVFSANLSAHAQVINRPLADLAIKGAKVSRPESVGRDATVLQAGLRERSSQFLKIENNPDQRRKQSITLDQGGVATGGGETASQDVRSLISQLPTIIANAGLQYFPEINMNDLENKVKSFIRVEGRDSLSVNGAPKTLQFFITEGLVLVDYNKWSELGNMPDGEARKQAIVLHEVLGLMGLEQNNDYSISNRLLGLQYLAVAGNAGRTNQIVPTDHRNQQIIFWRTLQDGKIAIYHCADRRVLSSCNMMGSRGYSAFELKAASEELAVSIKAKMDRRDKFRNGGTIALYLFGGLLLTAWVLTSLPATLALALPLAMFSVVGGTASIPFIGANQKGYLEQIFKEKVQPALTIAQQKSGVASIDNFNQYASSLNQFLNSIDSANSKLLP
jgi:hypothetical protein